MGEESCPVVSEIDEHDIEPAENGSREGGGHQDISQRAIGGIKPNDNRSEKREEGAS